MLQFTTTFNRSIGAVYAYLSDPAAWHLCMPSLENLSQRPIAPGATWQFEGYFFQCDRLDPPTTIEVATNNVGISIKLAVRGARSTDVTASVTDSPHAPIILETISRLLNGMKPLLDADPDTSGVQCSHRFLRVVMEYTEQQKTEFKERFAKKWRRQIVLTIVSIGAMSPLVIAEKSANQAAFGIPPSVWGPFVLVMLVTFAGLTLYNWRCPACGRYLGRSFRPSFCPKCGVALR